MTRFEASLAFILKVEGGLTPDKKTNHGIEQATYDAFRRKNHVEPRPVELITASEVSSIYLTEYWTSCACSSLPAGLDLAVFDAAVQHGPEMAAKLLQRLLKVKEDGAIGPVTLAAVKARPAPILGAELLKARATRIYIHIEDTKWDKNGRGWLVRLSDLNLECLRQM